MKKWQKILGVVGVGVLSCAIGVGVTIPVVTEKVYDSTLIGSYRFTGQTNTISTAPGDDSIFEMYDQENKLETRGTYRVQDTVMNCYNQDEKLVGSIIYSYGKYYWIADNEEPREVRKVSDAGTAF